MRFYYLHLVCNQKFDIHTPLLFSCFHYLSLIYVTQNHMKNVVTPLEFAQTTTMCEAIKIISFLLFWLSAWLSQAACVPSQPSRCLSPQKIPQKSFPIAVFIRTTDYTTTHTENIKDSTNSHTGSAYLDKIMHQTHTPFSCRRK